MSRLTKHLSRDSRWKERPFRFAALTLIGVCVASLFTPWIAEGTSHRGYEFLFGQTASNRTVASSTMSFFPIDPSLFSELRFQVTLVFVLLGLSAIWYGLINSREKKSYSVLKRILVWGSVGGAILLGNALLYAAVLRYESGTKNINWVFDMIMTSQGIRTAMGLPLIIFHTCYGFWMFVFGFCCLVLLNITDPPAP